MHVSDQSVEYIRAVVAASDDPTIGTVAFTFSTTDTPGTWVPGEWDGPATEQSGYFHAVAKVLVGPGHVVLPGGTVTVWVRVASSPESMVRAVGTIDVS